MRSKAPLAMMEQMVMLLVFALAAALCLQAFVISDDQSAGMEARDRAMTLCQSAAEAIRSTGGDFEQAAELLGARGEVDSLLADYDADWNKPSGGIRYELGAARQDSGVPGLGKAVVWVKDMSIKTADDDLFRLEVAWQEVSAHG